MEAGRQAGAGGAAPAGHRGPPPTTERQGVRSNNWISAMKTRFVGHGPARPGLPGGVRRRRHRATWGAKREVLGVGEARFAASGGRSSATDLPPPFLAWLAGHTFCPISRNCCQELSGSPPCRNRHLRTPAMRRFLGRWSRRAIYRALFPRRRINRPTISSSERRKARAANRSGPGRRPRGSRDPRPGPTRQGKSPLVTTRAKTERSVILRASRPIARAAGGTKGDRRPALSGTHILSYIPNEAVGKGHAAPPRGLLARFD